MDSSNTRDWLVDSTPIIVLGGIIVFVQPFLFFWFSRVSLRLGCTLFWVHFVMLDHLLPNILTGYLLGLAAGLLIRHRKPSIALLPSVVFSAFYPFYLPVWAGARSLGDCLDTTL